MRRCAAPARSARSQAALTMPSALLARASRPDRRSPAAASAPCSSPERSKRRQLVAPVLACRTFATARHIPPLPRGRRKDEEGEKGPHAEKETKRTLAPLMPSIVKIRVVESAPDYAIPWQQTETGESSGSGCVILFNDGRHRVLTNAHVVHNHTFVRLQKQGSAHQYQATVAHVSYACDLAVLEVDDPAFFKGCTAMEFAPTPNLQDSVVVLGYPEGGDSISVTKGIVSRLELSNFAGGSFGVTHDDGLKLLSLQIDAALNPGNSGGPAVNEHNQIIGIVFSKLSWSENVGYLVPSEVVLHFLKDIEEGHTPEFCSPGFYYQSCENASLRARKKIPPGESGVLVIAVDPLSPSAVDGTLKRGDVILRVDGVQVADDGTILAQDAGIAAAEHLRLSFEYLVSVRKHVGDSVKYTILRDGEVMEVQTTVTSRQYLIPPFSLIPSYFLHAGLLFVPLSEQYLGVMESEVPVVGRMFYRNTRTQPGEQLVVIMKVLADEVNIGFDHLELPKQVVSCNGTKIKNLAHLIELVEGSKDKFIELDLDSGEQIILETSKAKESNPRIMRRYHVHSLRSANLLSLTSKNGNNGRSERNSK